MGTLQQRSPRAAGRTLMAHLGNGAGLCAALEGRSVATTMGFSALDGLMMGTRCTAPSTRAYCCIYWNRLSHERIQSLLYKQSGLLGVSGIAADMRTLRADPRPAAQFAIDLFTHRIVGSTGELTASMSGLDLLAFSGGIGENDAVLRARVCQKLAYLGVRVDEARNQQTGYQSARPIHTTDSAVEVWVVPTDEGHVAASEAAALILPN